MPEQEIITVLQTIMTGLLRSSLPRAAYPWTQKETSILPSPLLRYLIRQLCRLKLKHKPKRQPQRKSQRKNEAEGNKRHSPGLLECLSPVNILITVNSLVMLFCGPVCAFSASAVMFWRFAFALFVWRLWSDLLVQCRPFSVHLKPLLLQFGAPCQCRCVFICS